MVTSRMDVLILFNSMVRCLVNVSTGGKCNFTFVKRQHQAQTVYCCMTSYVK